MGTVCSTPSAVKIQICTVDVGFANSNTKGADNNEVLWVGEEQIEKNVSFEEPEAEPTDSKGTKTPSEFTPTDKTLTCTSEEDSQAEIPPRHHESNLSHISTNSSEALEQVRCLLEDKCDALEAQAVLKRLREGLGLSPQGEDEWVEVRQTGVFHRLVEELQLFQEIGRVCCSDDQDWFSVYQSPCGNQSLSLCLDERDPKVLQYRVHLVFPVKLTNAFAIGNEVELGPMWNKFLLAPAEVLHRSGAMRVVLSSKQSVLAGMITNDACDEIRRFVDPAAGLLVEDIRSTPTGSEYYRAPSRGYKRTDTKIRSVWAACGPGHTLLRQVGTLRVPFKVTKRLGTTVGGLVGKTTLAGLVRNAMKSTEPGNPWEAYLAKDEFGVYQRLDECVASDASMSRQPQDGRFGEPPNLSQYFNNRTIFGD